MFEYAPTLPVKTEHSRTSASLDQAPARETLNNGPDLDPKQLKKFERKMRRRERAVAWLSGLAIVSSSISFGYNSDVLANQERASISQPTIETINDANNDSSIFYLAGFDTRDGTVYGDRLSIALHQFIEGSDESINYGDAPLEPEEIAKKIIEHAENQNLSKVSLSGNSLGGIVAMKAAEYIIANSTIEVESIVLNATPDGSAGLLSETKGDLAMMMEALEKIPNSKYSSFARYVMTLAQEKDRFIHEDTLWDAITSFSETSDTVLEQIKERRRPGMWLIVDQALAIINANMKDSLMNIGKLRDEKRMPVIVIMRTQNPMDDSVVDVETSSKNICEYAKDANLDCTIILIPHASHTSYDFDSEQYSLAIAPHTEEITRAIDREKSAFAISRFGGYLNADRIERELATTSSND